MSAGMSMQQVRAGYGPLEVLHGLTMVFPAGAVTALVGRNGAGKSSVLRCLAGFVPVQSGSIRWDGHRVSGWPTSRRARAGLTLVPDQSGVFSDLTVEENLRVFAGGQPTDPALEVFPELAGRLDQRAGTLSGGEQQMLALSRAFLRPGRVLLVDEVSRGLSPGVTARCYRALAGLVDPARVVVIVEQYLREVLGVADVVYVLARGEVAFAGEPGELAAGEPEP